ncbi:hypothetical protein DUU67_17965, partial [Salmonella enterica subsp. enterica serovar Kentucky]|nr:hypothetical protein [Salmonella enterica subsp. enterica serovar Kentucky]
TIIWPGTQKMYGTKTGLFTSEPDMVFKKLAVNDERTCFLGWELEYIQKGAFLSRYFLFWSDMFILKRNCWMGYFIMISHQYLNR